MYCVLWERLLELRVWKKRKRNDRLRELRIWNFCCGQRTTDTDTGTRGVLRGPRGPKNQKCVVQRCSFSLEILVCTPQPCCQCLLLLFVKATQFPCTGQPPALWVCELTELIRYEHMSLWVWVWSYEFLCLQGVENLTIVTENVPPLVITNDKSLSKHIWYFSQTEC